jgi:glycosyltransferase involved in cell wall biosynthesis
MIRPLYISPLGRGGVDFGIQNITRAVAAAGMQPTLLRTVEFYNFVPALLSRALPADIVQRFDIVQGRSRIAFSLRGYGRPVVTTVHHLTTDPALRPYSSTAQRLFHRLVEARYDGRSIRSADAVVCVSRYTQKQMTMTYGRRDSELIYDAIDTDVFAPTPDLLRSDDGLPPSDARIRLLFVGNRTRRKGFDLLPAIMDLLPDDYVLYFTGGFQSTAAAAPHPRMINIGSPDRAGLVAAYRSSDMLLFPSRLEGFGIAPAEALACGRPVVTTNASALPEVVDHGRSGYLVARDDVAQYAEAVRRLGEDARLRQQFGEFGREKVVRKFGYPVLAAAFGRLYQRLIGR